MIFIKELIASTLILNIKKWREKASDIKYIKKLEIYTFIKTGQS